MEATKIGSVCPFAHITPASEKIIQFLKTKIKYQDEKPLRIFHAKTIALVKAYVTIKEDLDPVLKVGLFENPGCYEAWVRFSNASSQPGPDVATTVRGMAIKILNVDNGQGEKCDQDIILSNSPIFVPGKEAFLLSAVKLLLGSVFEKLFAVVRIFTSYPERAIAYLKNNITTPNVLEEMYYSGTPYAFGKNGKIKWRVRPLKTITSVIPEHPAENFLRERLIKDLSTSAPEEIRFALEVQFQQHAITEPIDESSIEWKTPFFEVATITLIKQELDTDENKALDQVISFAPAHAIPEHAPLGSVNEVRAHVYEEMAKTRQLHHQYHSDSDR